MTAGRGAAAAGRRAVRGRRAGVLLLVTALGASLAAGCGGARNALGTTASACFHDLPAAKTAVGNQGRLVGVRRVSTEGLRRRMPNTPQLAETPAKDLCLFAFQGTYRPGEIPVATNVTPGKYALAAVEFARPTVVAVVVLDQLPTRFTHLR